MTQEGSRPSSRHDKGTQTGQCLVEVRSAFLEPEREEWHAALIEKIATEGFKEALEIILVGDSRDAQRNTAGNPTPFFTPFFMI